MKTLLINKKAFIEWYFDQDVKKTFFDDHNIFLNLVSNGVFTIKLNDLLQQAGYLPQEIAEEGQDLILNEEGEIDRYAYDKISFGGVRFSLEKETEYQNGKIKEKYFIHADNSCIGFYTDENEAIKEYELAKQNYIEPSRKILKSEYL